MALIVAMQALMSGAAEAEWPSLRKKELNVSYHVFRSLRSDDSIWHVAQDDDGFIWLSTTRGLLRYDGVRFESPEAFKSLSSPTAKLTTRAGDHWLTPIHYRWDFREDGSIEQRKRSSAPLIRIHGKQRTQFDPGKDFPGSINVLQEDASGTVWIGTTAGLFAWDGAGFVDRAHDNGLPRAEVMSLDVSYPMAVGTSSGVFVRRNDGWQQIGPMRPISAVTTDRDGSVWAGTGIGLFHIRDSGTKVYTRADGLPDHHVRALAIAPDGSLWMGLQGGLVRYHQGHFSTNTMSKKDIVDDYITSLLVDRDHNVWAGSRAGGVVLAKERHVVNLDERDNIAPGPSRSMLVATDGSAWLVSSGGVNQIVGNRIRLIDMQALSSAKITAATTSQRGGLWLGVDNGRLLHVDADGVTNWGKAPGHTVTAIHEQGDGTLWVASNEGELSHLDVKPGTFTNLETISSPCAAPTHLVRGDKAGNLWMATTTGLAQWGPGGVRCHRGRRGADPVLALLIDADGSVWFSTPTALHRLERDQVKTFNAGGHLRLCNGQRGIVDDGRGNLLLACGGGLVRFPRTLMDTPPEDLSHFSADIIQTSRIAEGPGAQLSLTPDRRLWAATKRGLMMFSNTDHPLGRETVHPVIQEVRADGRKVNAEQGSLFVSAPGSLHITWTAPSYAAPERLLFSYRLIGVDHQWQGNRPERFVQYEDLPPGRYTFEVVVASNLFSPQQKAARLLLLIGPPWWSQTRVRLGALAAVGLFLAMIFRWRWHQMRRAGQAVEAERSRIARDLHDGLGQDFMALSFHIDALEKRLDNNAATKEVLDRTRQLVERAREDARSAVWKLENHSGDDVSIKGLLDKVVEDFRATGQDQRLNLQLADTSILVSPVVGHEVASIAREALTNAIRYGGKGAIDLSCNLTNECIRLSIRDRGPGFDPKRVSAKNGHHFGLMSMNERAKKLGGVLQIESVPGQGTCVTIDIPKQGGS